MNILICIKTRKKKKKKLSGDLPDDSGKTKTLSCFPTSALLICWFARRNQVFNFLFGVLCVAHPEAWFEYKESGYFLIVSQKAVFFGFEIVYYIIVIFFISFLKYVLIFRILLIFSFYDYFF